MGAGSSSAQDEFTQQAGKAAVRLLGFGLAALAAPAPVASCRVSGDSSRQGCAVHTTT